MNQRPRRTKTPQPQNISPPARTALTKVSSSQKLLPGVKSPRVLKSGKRGWLATLGAIALLLIAATLTVGGGWISMQLILNPDTAIWLNRYLPAWTRLPTPGGDSLKTLSEVRTSLEQAGLVAGEFLPLTKHQKQSTPDLLLSVLNQEQQITELRVYRPAPIIYRSASNEPYFWLVSQVELVGPEESFVIAPLVTAQSANQGSSRPLPLTTLERFQEKTPTAGIWLNLRGEWAQGDLRVPYGYIVHYNPARNHLSLMLPWTSPGASGPQWQELTGGGTPELVLNQTVGLEPQLKIYQLKPRKFVPNPIQLEAISLSAVSLKSAAYENALILARSGLWSPALQWLKSLKRLNPLIAKRWSGEVQAQMSLIQVHAQRTKVQAEKSWASPSEQVLAYLIDGRWTRALQVFQASADTSEIATLLKTDSGRLWRRVTAALKVSSNQPDVKAWGALMVSAKQGRGKAIAWLKQQGKTSPAVNTKIYQLLNQLDRSLPNDQGLTSYHSSQIIGSARPLAGLNAAAWFPPDPKQRLKLEPGQRWYAITVASFYDGKAWKRSPFKSLQVSTATVGQVWNLLGLNGDTALQILAWTADGQQTTITATVQALQFRGGELRLLASGDSLPQTSRTGSARQPLALTTNALQWIEPGSTTLAELNQQNPDLVTAMFKNLWRELQGVRQVRGALPNLEGLLQSEAIGGWQVQQVDLTGNNQLETLLTFEASAFSSLQAGAAQPSKSSKSRTMIFSETGTVIYSEFSREGGQALVAIADLTDGGPPGLIVNITNNYTIERWSAKKQRFE